MSKKLLQILLLVSLATLLLIMPSPLPDYLTTFDFQAYWGASHLLSRSENFTDPDLLLEIERAATGFDEETPLQAWNPPWLVAWLLPFGVMSFPRASWFWLLANIVLVFTSTSMLWTTFAGCAKTRRWLWLGLVVAFLFLPTLTTLLVGQIAALVLFGIAGFVFFVKRDRHFLAGLALSLTTAKPHLLYLTLVLVVLELIVRKQWRTVAGFAAPVLGGTVIAFMLRPRFMSDYISMMSSSRLLQRSSVPTLSSYLAGQLQLPWLRLIGIAVLVVGLVLWGRRKRHGSVDLVQMLVLTLVVSLLTTPYGWSFDFILFLVPVLQIAVRFIEGRIPRASALAIAIPYTAANVAMLYQRTQQVRENAYFWFPVLLAVVVGWGWLSAEFSMTDSLETVPRKAEAKSTREQ